MPEPPDNLERAGAWETLGAWLHVWTPRRGTYVPPVPKAKIAMAATVAALAVAVAVLLIADAAERGTARAARDLDAARERSRAVAAEQQKPQRLQLTAPSPQRERLVGALEDAITADARGRLHLPTRFTSCTPYVRPRVENPPEPPPGARVGKYECLATTATVAPTERTEGGHAGHPFWARVDFRRGRAVWCKINPRPAEGGIGRDPFVALQPVCNLRLDRGVPAA